MRLATLVVFLLILSSAAAGQSSCDGESTFCGATIPGTIVDGACPTGCIEFSQSHAFNVFGNTTLMTFTATSSDFTPTIEVLSADGTIIDRRDGRAGQSTRFGVVLPPGVHHARVVAQPTGSSGSYTLRLSCLIADPEVFCQPNATTLCLYNRFQARATIRSGGTQTMGAPTRIGDVFGSFAAPELTGNAENPEIVVKVLDGRAINGRWWVFIGGLTGFDYEVTVRDTMYKRERTWTKSEVDAGDGVDFTTFFER